MSGRQPDDYYIALERRLRTLLPQAEAVLPPEPYGWVLEYLDAGEYGLAVEVASEEMPERDVSPEARELASGLLREAELVGLPDEVTRRLLARERFPQ
jgi:hypothetical protein